MLNIATTASDMEIASIDAAAAVSAEADFTTLDDRMLKAYAQSAIALSTERNDVVQGIELQPGKLSDPAHLFEMQQRISDYSLQVSLTSALTRKAVSAVETLLRA
jgi:hypothetical protein